MVAIATQPVKKTTATVGSKRKPNPTLAAKEPQSNSATEIAPAKNASQPRAANKRNQQPNRRAQQQHDTNGVAQLAKGIKVMAVQETEAAEPKIEAIYQQSVYAKHSSANVEYSLFQNSSNELLFYIRKTEEDGSYQRIVAPFSFCEIFIEKLNIGLNELNVSKQAGILKQLNSDQNAYFVNMLTLSSKRSRYFVDFKANEDKSDIILQISERKRILSKNGTKTRSFILEFNVYDMNIIIDRLTKFYAAASDAISTTPDLDIHKVYGCSDFTLEWVKPRHEVNLLLKFSSNSGNRVMFPVNTVRQLKNNLIDVFDSYKKCGDNSDGYMDILRAKRKEINERREKNGRDLLPEIVESLDQQINKNSRSKGSDEVRSNPYKLLYSQKMISKPNRRTYHFDLVSNLESGDIRMRIVEQQHSQGAHRQQQDPRTSRQMRHTIFVPIVKVPEILETLNTVNEDVPLPKEKAHYYPDGRCFFKINVRPKGLTLKIKTQSALNDEEIAEAAENEESSSQPPANQTKYGNATSIELPMGTVRKLMNYLKENTSFADHLVDA